MKEEQLRIFRNDGDKKMKQKCFRYATIVFGIQKKIFIRVEVQFLCMGFELTRSIGFDLKLFNCVHMCRAWVSDKSFVGDTM